MGDMIAEGEAMFEETRRAHMSIDAVFKPKDSFVEYPCKITLVVGKWDSVTAANQIIRTETKDIFLAVEDYSGEPRKGDRFECTVNGQEHVYEVTLPRDREKEWSWQNRSETLRRVHTFRRKAPTAVFEDGVFEPGVFAA